VGFSLAIGAAVLALIIFPHIIRKHTPRLFGTGNQAAAIYWRLHWRQCLAGTQKQSKKITGKYFNIVLRGYLLSELFYAEANHNNSFIL
jgi:hypothetical protein